MTKHSREGILKSSYATQVAWLNLFKKATIAAGRIARGQIPQANVTGYTGYLPIKDGRASPAPTPSSLSPGTAAVR
jgi:hypothetical protein